MGVKNEPIMICLCMASFLLVRFFRHLKGPLKFNVDAGSLCCILCDPVSRLLPDLLWVTAAMYESCFSLLIEMLAFFFTCVLLFFL